MKAKILVLPGDGIGPEVTAKSVAALDTGEERALDEIVDLVGRLVGKEAAHAVEVAVEQLVAGPRLNKYAKCRTAQ